MPSRHDELDLTAVRTQSIHERKSKVSVDDFARPLTASATVGHLVDALPTILAANDLRTLLKRVARAVRGDQEWIFMMGGHVVKTGLAPVICPLIREGWITSVAMNGSAAIHDAEIALFGRTSEVVEESLRDGSFGMAEETASFVNGAAQRAHDLGIGFGEALGDSLQTAPHAENSFLATGAGARIPVTVHVALGTDIVHQHPSASGAAIGDATLRDFRTLAARVSRLAGGVVWNVGSAVVMPEVFLKALTVARNLGEAVDDFTAANFDMNRHYRPLTNVVRRPTAEGGWGADFTGNHEILLPLVVAALRERLAGSPQQGAS